jgi:hypothetical protein
VHLSPRATSIRRMDENRVIDSAGQVNTPARSNSYNAVSVH